MNRYRLLFWHGDIMKDCYIKAESEEEALKKFAEKWNGKKDKIIRIINIPYLDMNDKNGVYIK